MQGSVLKYDNTNGYRSLPGAIMAVAIHDYRRSIKWLREHPNPRGYGKREQINRLKMKKDVEQFIRSEWFTFLTGLNGERVMRLMEDEWKD